MDEASQIVIHVNGTRREVPPLGSVQALLDHLGISAQAVGVLRNGVVVAREDFSGEPVADGDVLEIVRFVGGG
jgi:sulfur carrier protein